MPQLLFKQEKMIEWFIQDINENLGWSDVYVTEDQIKEVAIHKVKNLMNYVEKGDAYEPFK